MEREGGPRPRPPKHKNIMKGGAKGVRGAGRHAPRIRTVAVSQAKQKCPLGRRGRARKPRSARGNRAKHIRGGHGTGGGGQLSRGAGDGCSLRASPVEPARWQQPAPERAPRSLREARWRTGKGERRPCGVTASHPPEDRRASKTKVPFRAEGGSEETPQRARAPRKTRARMPRG